jgi:hypothetical protein
MRRLLHVGDRVLFEDAEHQVTAVSGTWVRLLPADGTAAAVPSAVLLTHLVGSPGFAILSEDLQRLAGTALFSYSCRYPSCSRT